MRKFQYKEKSKSEVLKYQYITTSCQNEMLGNDILADESKFGESESSSIILPSYINVLINI